MAAEAYQNLGQANPLATTDTNLCTVPAGKAYVVSTIVICNTGATDRTYRIRVGVGGAGATTKQYIAYDATIKGNDSKFITVGITLATTDIINVYASGVELAFSAFGSVVG